jgi:membrane-associated phospholipid phosphatase
MYRILLIFLFLISTQALPQVNRRESFIEFSGNQYLWTSGIALADLILTFQPLPDKAKWNGGVLFDSAVRDFLRLSSRDARDRAATVGNVMLSTLVAYPIVVDAALDAGWVQNDSQMAIQMALMDARAFLLTGLGVLLFKQIVARERPYQSECSDPNYDGGCNTGDSRVSFFSGHTAFSFTGAGLICAHHKGLELAGGMSPCYVSVGAAFAVGLTRILADRHYASDVLVGATIGWLSGYVMTRAFHYSEADKSVSTGVALVIPTVSDRGLGLTLNLKL